MRLFMAVFLLIPSFAFAGGSYESNGYYVSANISSIARNLFVEGRVTGNVSCKNLVIAVYVEDEEGQLYQFKTDRFEYRAGLSILYETQTAHIGSSQGDAEINSIEVSCGDPT